ncbi:alpha-amylase family glycosyl hydrolase [Rhizobium sp. NLR22b]|uniref:alpha-amylase family glycosyl hydrolase n=1 Tax=Rhizobium sp. NLR22b TaxID=2731115 RepID=UPI0038702F21
MNLKTVLSKWQLALSEDGWNSLFWGNHDLPRAVSRYGNVSGYHVESAKMLATVLHLLKGTPFVYQGEEIGMTNVPFTSIEQYRDIETINMHRLHVEAGLSPEEFIRGANENGRDNARTPMQWSAAPYGGFSTGAPWIEVNPNYPKVNAEAAIKDEKSIWNHYRKLIALPTLPLSMGSTGPGSTNTPMSSCIPARSTGAGSLSSPISRRAKLR